MLYNNNIDLSKLYVMLEEAEGVKAVIERKNLMYR